MLKFFMWNILSLNYERHLNYVKKTKPQTPLNTFANSFTGTHMIHLEVKNSLFTLQICENLKRFH